MNSTLGRKKFIQHLLHLLLPLLFGSWYLPYKLAAVVSQHIRTYFSTTPLFNLGNILMEPLAMFTGDGSHLFRKKIQMEMQKMKFPMTCQPHSTV